MTEINFMPKPSRDYSYGEHQLVATPTIFDEYVIHYINRNQTFLYIKDLTKKTIIALIYSSVDMAKDAAQEHFDEKYKCDLNNPKMETYYDPELPPLGTSIGTLASERMRYSGNQTRNNSSDGVGFGSILGDLKLNIPFRRAIWDSEVFIYYVPSSRFTVDREPLTKFYRKGEDVVEYGCHIDIRCFDGVSRPWNPEYDDIFATDWQEYTSYKNRMNGHE